MFISIKGIDNATLTYNNLVNTVFTTSNIKITKIELCVVLNRFFLIFWRVKLEPWHPDKAYNKFEIKNQVFCWISNFLTRDRIWKILRIISRNVSKIAPACKETERLNLSKILVTGVWLCYTKNESKFSISFAQILYS